MYTKHDNRQILTNPNPNFSKSKSNLPSQNCFVGASWFFGFYIKKRHQKCMQVNHRYFHLFSATFIQIHPLSTTPTHLNILTILTMMTTLIMLSIIKMITLMILSPLGSWWGRSWWPWWSKQCPPWKNSWIRIHVHTFWSVSCFYW